MIDFNYNLRLIVNHILQYGKVLTTTDTLTIKPSLRIKLEHYLKFNLARSA